MCWNDLICKREIQTLTRFFGENLFCYVWWETITRLCCSTNLRSSSSSTYTEASIFGDGNISAKMIWRINLAVPVWDTLDVELVGVLLNNSWLSHLVFKRPPLSWSFRETKRMKGEKTTKKTCHMQVHLHSTATECQACHTPTTLCLGVTSRTVIFWTIMSHSSTSHFKPRFMRCAVGLPWQHIASKLSVWRCNASHFIIIIIIIILAYSFDPVSPSVLHVVTCGSVVLQ